MLAASSLLVRPAVAQPLAPKDTQPYKKQVYDVAFSHPNSDWVAVPAGGPTPGVVTSTGGVSRAQQNAK